jgi:hypothetical protein|uniref:RING-type domain-containing protein n=1 Tax=viral metagenome TaxID=1070528 RepID=A0A6C0IT74_9ZZZZ
MFLVRKLFPLKSPKVTPIIFYDPEGSLRFVEDDCSICLDKLTKNQAKLPCGHYFHTNCILEWVDKKNMTCPICRQHLVWSKKLKNI